MTILIVIAGILAVAAGYIFVSYKKMKNIPAVEKSEKIKDLTDKNFNHQIKNNISLVDFWAPWCVPCKMMAPVLNDIADKADSGVQVCKVNVDEYQSLASKYGIRGIPTTVLFRNGKEVGRLVGVKSKDFLLNQINSIKQIIMKSTTSLTDFLSKLPASGRSYLLLYKSDNENSLCAYSNIDEIMKDDLFVFSADVSLVRDIHIFYGIDSVPSLLVFEDGKFSNVIKGCHESSYYEALFNNELFSTAGTGIEKETKRVTVYSTPTCSWCNTLKAWLQKNQVRYIDIDVSRDEKAAEELVRRSGQQGVPQTDINGQIVVGFNQPRLKELLGIN